MASTIKNIKVYDIVYSLNQVRITSMKQMNKIILKAATGPLKFVVQRPCILMTNQILTSSSSKVQDSDEQTANQLTEQQTLPVNTNLNDISAQNSSSKPSSQTTTSIPAVTHTASSSCLVDYFCSVSECSIVSFNYKKFKILLRIFLI